MTDENAALAEDVTLDTELDQTQGEVANEAETESATENDVTTDKPEDGFQKRINKVTADKYTEKRRADDLQRQLDEERAKPAATPAKAPALEDFDHDEDLYKAALIKHEVAIAVSANATETAQQSSNKTAQDAQEAFNGRIDAFEKDDWDVVAARVPELPLGVADALVRSKDGVDLIYHLGEHLDIADKIAGMTPADAFMELGQISAGLNAKPDIKPSAAPDPIEPLASGGKLSKTERGPAGATFV